MAGADDLPTEAVAAQKFRPTGSAWKGLLLVAAVAVVAHGTFLLAVAPLPWLDSLRYCTLAATLWERLAERRWDMVTDPGYPLFLWVLSQLTDRATVVVAVQQALAVGACLVLLPALRRAFGPRLALAGALALALSPFRHYYAQCLLTESVAEFLVLAGIGLALSSAGRPSSLLLPGRAGAGLLLGTAILVRSSVLPVALLAAALPPGSAPAGDSRRRFAAAVAASAAGIAIVCAPWIAFNASRGVSGLSSRLGYQLTQWMNWHGIGEPATTHVRLVPETDRALRRAALQRARQAPLAYAKAVVRSGLALIFPFPRQGPEAVRIPSCEAVSPSQPVVLFQVAPGPLDGWWRRAVHRMLCPLYYLLVPAGWAGLVGWGVSAAVRRRFDHALPAALACVPVLVLSLMVHANHRHAFVFESIALAFGLPALAVALGSLRSEAGRRWLAELANRWHGRPD